MVDGHVRMGIGRQLASIAAGLEIVRGYPEFAGVPVILGESDPEGCAACSTATHPENAYRDGPLYGVSVVEAIARTLEISEAAGVTIEGAVTWAFEFEDTPFFAGFRELATNGIAKPVLNALRMMAMLKGARLAATSSAALPLATILTDGVSAAPDIDLIAAADGDTVRILIWNYHDDDRPTEGGAEIALTVTGLGAGARTCRHFRMDGSHSNAHAVFLAMGAPQPPSPALYRELEQAARLSLLEQPSQLTPRDGRLAFAFSLPRQGVSLIELTPV